MLSLKLKCSKFEKKTSQSAAGRYFTLFSQGTLSNLTSLCWVNLGSAITIIMFKIRCLPYRLHSSSCSGSLRRIEYFLQKKKQICSKKILLTKTSKLPFWAVYLCVDLDIHSKIENKESI